MSYIARSRTLVWLLVLCLAPLACGEPGISDPGNDDAPLPRMSHDDRDDDRDDDKDDDDEGDDRDRDDRDDRDDDEDNGYGPPDFLDLPVGALGSFAGSPPVTPELVNETIGPEGGSIRLGDFEIVVPPGAVEAKTLFMIRRPVDARSRQRVVAEFRPHHVRFEEPVTVRFPYRGTDLEGNDRTAVVVWSRRERDWLRFPSEVVEDGARLEARVPHLSFWGISLRGTDFYGVLSSGGD
jgi:hypothetical protein